MPEQAVEVRDEEIAVFAVDEQGEARDEPEGQQPLAGAAGGDREALDPEAYEINHDARDEKYPCKHGFTPGVENHTRDQRHRIAPAQRG